MDRHRDNYLGLPFVHKHEYQTYYPLRRLICGLCLWVHAVIDLSVRWPFVQDSNKQYHGIWKMVFMLENVWYMQYRKICDIYAVFIYSQKTGIPNDRHIEQHQVETSLWYLKQYFYYTYVLTLWIHLVFVMLPSVHTYMKAQRTRVDMLLTALNYCTYLCEKDTMLVQFWLSFWCIADTIILCRTELILLIACCFQVIFSV